MIGCWHYIILIYISSSYAVDQYFFISQFKYLLQYFLIFVSCSFENSATQGDWQMSLLPLHARQLSDLLLAHWCWKNKIISYNMRLFITYIRLFISYNIRLFISCNIRLFISYNIRLFIHQKSIIYWKLVHILN